MKSIIYSLLMLLLLTACQEKVILEDLTTEAPRLVIEADLFWDKSIKDNTQTQTVQLSTTVAFYGTEIPEVANAEVKLTDSKGNLHGTFLYKEKGKFVASDFTEPQIGEVYTLSVLYKGQTYQGTHLYRPVTDFTKITESKPEIFGEQITQINYEFFHEIDVDNSFLVRYDYIEHKENTEDIVLLKDYDESKHDLKVFYDILDDRVASDIPGENTIEGVYWFEETPKNGQEFKITLASTSSSQLIYMAKYLINVGEHGGPQASAPAVIKGNMYNIDDKKNYPLGFFAIGESVSRTYIIGDNVLD